MYQNLKLLQPVDKREESIHFTLIPEPNLSAIDESIEEAVEDMSACIVLGRKIRDQVKKSVKVPLKTATIIHHSRARLERLHPLVKYIQSELNLFDVQLISDADAYVSFQMCPNRKALGTRYGKHLKTLTPLLDSISIDQVMALQAGGDPICLEAEGVQFELGPEDIQVEAVAKNTVPEECRLASDGTMTVMLDVTVDTKQIQMGQAREFAARVQKLRKSSGLREHDEVEVFYGEGEAAESVAANLEYTNKILKVASLLPMSAMPTSAVVVGREAASDKLNEIVLTRRTPQLCMSKFVAAYGEQNALLAENFMLSMDFQVAKEMLEQKITPVEILCGSDVVRFNFVLGDNTFLSVADLLRHQ
jgi:isoleucyl-tRNA synthetase